MCMVFACFVPGAEICGVLPNRQFQLDSNADHLAGSNLFIVVMFLEDGNSFSHC